MTKLYIFLEAMEAPLLLILFCKKNEKLPSQQKFKMFDPEN
jgi:hypothetical protein